jgi:hypothetical protein
MSATTADTIKILETLPESEQEFVYQFIQKIAKASPKPKKKRLTQKEKEDALFYSEPNMAHLRESISQFEKGNIVIKTFDELLAMGQNV